MNLCTLQNFLLLCCALFCLALPPGLCAQESPPESRPPADFGGINSNLDALESLLSDTLNSSKEQESRLRNLELNLSEQERLLTEREASIQKQENLLRQLRRQLDGMSETYREQSALSAKYERSSRFWKTFTLIAIPAAALLSGGITAGVMAAVGR